MIFHLRNEMGFIVKMNLTLLQNLIGLLNVIYGVIN